MIHGIHLDYRKTFSVINFLHLVRQGIIRHDTRREKESVPQAIGTGTSFARDDEQNKGTIPMPMFARRPSTVSSLIPVDIPQNPQRQQISELQFDKFPTPHSFLCWKIKFKSRKTTCSDFPSDNILWINEVETVDSLEEVKSSRSIAGQNFPNIEILDARIASAFNKIIQNSHFKKKVSLEEQKSPERRSVPIAEDRSPYMIYDYFRVTGAHDSELDYADLFSVNLRDENVQECDARWDEVLLSMSKIPSDDILESLYKFRVRESAQLKTALELYDMEIHQKISMPKYQKLKTMVKRSIDQKLRLRNFDARHGKIETGAVVKSRKGSSGVEGGTGICYQRKEKGQCSMGDQCSFRHESDARAKPNRTRMSLHFLSHQ